ncbi:MAG: DUF255 domain-containing protein [Thiobacillaceae bacterium]
MRLIVRAVSILFLVYGPAFASGLLPGNKLEGSPSPFLAMHGRDTIKWQTWSPEAFDLAKRSGRLLFVSVGYFACHWCHVMHHESYENPRIAAYLNAHFIPVKVDRELNTGLDDELQRFASDIIHQGGWPLNAFVTPQGYPLSVVLYQRPDEFLKTLDRIAERWSRDQEKLAEMARLAAPHPQPLSVAPYGPQQQLSLLNSFLDSAQAESDPLQGGFGEVSKFPHVPRLNLLLAIQTKSPDPKREAWLRLSLDSMADRGLRDHVYGGFFRYTTDPGWTVPHFEKMLYDNAQLAMLYLRAARVLNEPRYQEVGRTTLDFMLSVLRDPESGGFYSSTSAIDSQGREGAAYLWSYESLKSLLSPEELRVARRVWQLDRSSFDSGYFLPAEYQQVTADERDVLSGAYHKLRTARPNVDVPRDRKMLTGLNGLALSAFSHAAVLDDRYRNAANKLYTFMASQWRNGSVRKGQFGHQILPDPELEDYAYGASGLLDFAEAMKNKQAESLAHKWAIEGWKNFSGVSGWRREKSPLLKSARPRAVLEDGVIPSPSAVLIAASLRLNTPESVEKAQRALNWHSAEIQSDPFAYPTQIGLINGLFD